LFRSRQPKIAIREATKQGYAIAEQGDSVNVTYPDSKTRRDRVGKQVAQTLQAGEVNQGVVMDDTQGYDGIRTYDGISPTLRSSRSGLKTIVTPKEESGEVNQGVVMGGDFDDKEIERNTLEILQTLQKEIGEKEIAKWRSRILDTFQQEEILRQ